MRSLEDVIAGLMIRYGPDGHCDGSEIIAQFVRDYAKDAVDALERWGALVP